MIRKILLFVYLATCTNQILNPVESMTGLSSLYAYNNFWDGAIGGRGYWGRTPSYGLNVFSNKFDNNDFQKVYDLNSMSPFASNLKTGFDTVVPYFTPNGASKYTYHPTKSNYYTN